MSARVEGGVRSCLPFGGDEQGILYSEGEQGTIYSKIVRNWDVKVIDK
jgi:hypothetical protein